MTILSTEKILPLSGEVLWRVASQFEQAPRWVDGLEKVEHVSGPFANVGGVWRLHLHWEVSYQIIDLEITEWFEGERFSLRPLGAPGHADHIEFLQLVFNLKKVSELQTQVTVQCEYKPLNQFAKIKNLTFLRRHYLQRLEASLEALERIAVE